MFSAKLVKTEDIAQHIKTFWFEPERPVRYVAGQYLDLYVPHTNPDNRGIWRTMSLSTSPTEPLLGITTTFEPRGGSTFKHALLNLKSGQQVGMTDPMGDFVPPKNPTIPLVYVAGGIGITPVRGMVKWMIDAGEQREVHLIYITRQPADMLYIPLLTSYKSLKLTPVHTAAARPSTNELLKLIGDLADKLIYLSGPQPMMETFWYELQQHGVPQDQLILDYFTGYTKL